MTGNKSNHTPLLELELLENQINIWLSESEDRPEAEYLAEIISVLDNGNSPSFEDAKKWAALIVHRVNNWDKVVNGLQYLYDLIENGGSTDDKNMNEIKEALALAKEGK